MGMGLKIKNINIMGVHWKIWFLGWQGVTKDKYIAKGIAKKGGLGQFANLRRDLAKKKG